jgi:hypothetical protein
MSETPSPDWFIQEWLAHFGKKQAALTNELGWNKSRANFYWHSHQPYRREVVNEVATWLGIKPYELLMPPDEALALRRLRETAELIVSQGGRDDGSAPPSFQGPTRKTGTR